MDIGEHSETIHPATARLREHAWRDSLGTPYVALRRAEQEIERLAADSRGAVDALDFITGGIDREPWHTVYRQAGGGYEGLQAVARAALEGQ